MCAKSGYDPSRLLPSWDRSFRKSVLLNLISFSLDRNLKATELVHQGVRTIIGNGLNVNLWSDDWTVWGLSKEVFRRFLRLLFLSTGRWLIMVLRVRVSGSGMFLSEDNHLIGKLIYRKN